MPSDIGIDVGMPVDDSDVSIVPWKEEGDGRPVASAMVIWGPGGWAEDVWASGFFPELDWS